MNDLHDDLQELFRRREGDVRGPLAAPPPVIRRTRRRQVVNVVGTALGLAALVLVPFGLLRLSPSGDADRPVRGGQVELPVAPQGFRSAALPYVSIAYPDGWYLTDPSPLTWYGIARPEPNYSGPVLQLSNFDPDLHDAPLCTFDEAPIPDDGVLLTVWIQAPEDIVAPRPTQPWPVDLGPLPPNTDPVCPQGSNQTAAWIAPSGASYVANTVIGRDASSAEHDALVTAFGSLVFPPTSEPWMTTFATDQGQGSPRLVLDAATFEGAPITFMAFLDHYRLMSIGLSGPDERFASCCAGGSHALEPGESLIPVQTNCCAGPGGTIVYGDASPDVVRAEIRTDQAETFPATIVPIPSSIGAGWNAVWGIVGQPGLGAAAAHPAGTLPAQIVGYDVNGDLLGDPTLATGPPEVFASGDDPLAGHWEAAITHDTNGDGLSLTVGAGSGGSCCLGPDMGLDARHPDLRLQGESWGGGEASYAEAFASESVTRVEVVLDGGERLEAMLFPFPDGYIGPAQYVLVFIPADLDPRGHLIAYGADGRELQREPIGER